MCARNRPTTAPVAPLRKLHSLRPADVHAATTALQDGAADWTFDQHDDSQGDLMLMLTPPGDQDTTPTFILSRTAQGLELAVALGDSCDTLGTFDTAKNAVLHAQTVTAAMAAHRLGALPVT